MLSVRFFEISDKIPPSLYSCSDLKPWRLEALNCVDRVYDSFFNVVIASNPSQTCFPPWGGNDTWWSPISIQRWSFTHPRAVLSTERIGSTSQSSTSYTLLVRQNIRELGTSARAWTAQGLITPHLRFANQALPFHDLSSTYSVSI